MILDKIVASKKEEVKVKLANLNYQEMAREISKLPPTKDFQKSLTEGLGVSLIAEIKKASPSKGLLCPQFDPRQLAKAYSANGAAAVSVLTDKPFFGGRLEDLQQVRQTIDLPILRKDFLIDPIQLYESRLAGADAILLIAAILKDYQLEQMLEICEEIKLQTLVEVHTKEELQRVLTLGATVIGINNRNLHTFKTDLSTTAQLRKLIPPGITVISESGIRDKRDVDFLESIGVHGMLVGESLVTASNPGRKIVELLRGGGSVAV